MYEDTVEVVALLPGTWAGGRLRGSVSVQACTDQVCLPPAKLPFSVQRRGSPP